MPSFDLRGQKPLVQRTIAPVGALVLGLICTVAVHSPVWAQAVDAASTPSAPVAVPAKAPLQRAAPATVSFAPQWSALSSAQQQSLQPLANAWDGLSDGHKRKWIALAQNYPSLAPPEQAKLHSRMAEWAALKPRERELARLNFAETKKLPVPDRTSNWEAYKALSPEERRKLAQRATRKPVGAAATIKPVPPEKLTVIPMTRHTPQQTRKLEMSKQAIDRKTLLPLSLRPAPAASAPQN